MKSGIHEQGPGLNFLFKSRLDWEEFDIKVKMGRAVSNLSVRSVGGSGGL